MYRISDALRENQLLPHEDVWEDKILCTDDNAEREDEFTSEPMNERLAVFSYTIVLQGTVSFVYNGRLVECSANDVCVYSPGIEVSILSWSDDYKGIYFAIDDRTALGMKVVKDIIRNALFPILENTGPKLSLTPEQIQSLADITAIIRNHIKSDSPYKEQCLNSLCTLFVLDFAYYRQSAVTHDHESNRAEELFISFVSLLGDNFKTHHDIAFYASKLFITPTYLSRIVRQVTGRTVIDQINNLLLMEASYLLRHTSIPISQIAEELCFSESSAFTRFFTRMKGESPKRHRERKR